MPNEYLIRKETGELDPFSREKLEQSLIRAGADMESAESIADQIEKELVNGMSTRKIYKRALSLLHKRSVRAAGRYRMKAAIMELGPSGYPFEYFVTEIFRAKGYEATTGIVLRGHCINHEVDVLARKDGASSMVECKFRNRAGDKIDAKTILYIYARFLDLKEGSAHNAQPIQTVWVATNTRYTEDAVAFARCRGMHLLGWDFPHTESLSSLADKFGLHPVTCLHSLRKSEKEALLANKVVLCRDLLIQPELLAEIIPESHRRTVALREVRDLCESGF